MENEYGNVEWAYGVDGVSYVKWAAETAVGLNTSVPWVMCAQSDAPDPIVSICVSTYMHYKFITVISWSNGS